MSRLKSSNGIKKFLNKGFELIKIILSIIFTTSLISKEFVLNKQHIDDVIFYTTKDISANLIDNESISFVEARKVFDEINLKFEERKSIFKTKILKLSINASYLNRSLKEKSNEIISLNSLLKRKNSKLHQIESDIKGENLYIKDLKMLINKKIEFNSNISTQGYILTFVENRRSVSRDKFIEIATENINNEAIQQLNGIFVNSISRYDRDLSVEIQEISSGTAITDSSETTIKIFFSRDKKHSVLIYGTKVDVYPFEKGEIIKRAVLDKNSYSNKSNYLNLIRNDSDIHQVVEDIQKEYPKLNLEKNIEKKIKKALKSISIHNNKSRNVIIEIDKTHKEFVTKIEKRIKSRKGVIEVLRKHKKLLENEILELTIDLGNSKKSSIILTDKFQFVESEIIEVKRAVSFLKAEMYSRKHSNAVMETKNITKELLLDIDKSLLKTSKKMETIFNGSRIIKDIVDEVEYEKIYIKSEVIPYFVDNTDITGALVTLEIKFRDKKLAKNPRPKYLEFVHIPKGTFMFGSNVGDSDEKPIRKVEIRKDFLIGKYEVTIREYMDFAKSTKSHFPEWYNKKIESYKKQCLENSCPIMGISWIDAKAYLKWLSARDKKVYRLPTEEEWEYISKGDLNRDFGFLYGSLKDYSWFFKNSGGKSHRVGLKKPNLFGVYDMQGNVWEFCEDSYHHNYMDKSKDTYKVMRGGDWRTKKYYLRSSNRAKYRKNGKSSGIGFRVVQEIEKIENKE